MLYPGKRDTSSHQQMFSHLLIVGSAAAFKLSVVVSFPHIMPRHPIDAPTLQGTHFSLSAFYPFR